MGIDDTKAEIIAKRGYRKSIKGDQYSLYLSNYPVAADYLSERLENKGKILVELCCGVGVTMRAVASKFEKLIGIEIDSEVLDFCRQNLKAAGIASKIDFIQGDISDQNILKKIKADVAIYDIPYWVSKELPDGTNVLDRNPELGVMIEKIRKNITPNIVIFAPPYLKYNLVREQFGKCEFQKIFINGRYDRNYIFLGNLVEHKGVTEKRLKYSIVGGGITKNSPN